MIILLDVTSKYLPNWPIILRHPCNEHHGKRLFIQDIMAELKS